MSPFPPPGHQTHPRYRLHHWVRPRVKTEGQETESPLTHIDTHQGRNPCSYWDTEALCYCSIPQLSWPLWRIRWYLENFYFAWREVYCKVVARMRKVYWELPVFPSCRKKFKWQIQFLPQGFLLSVKWWDRSQKTKISASAAWALVKNPLSSSFR